MTEQLSLFGEENTLYNTAMQHLLDMDFAASRDAWEQYARMFPWARDVGHGRCQALRRACEGTRKILVTPCCFITA